MTIAVEIADPYAVVFLAGGVTTAIGATGWLIRNMIRQTELNTQLATTVREIQRDLTEHKVDTARHRDAVWARLREIEMRAWQPPGG